MKFTNKKKELNPCNLQRVRETVDQFFKLKKGRRGKKV